MRCSQAKLGQQIKKSRLRDSKQELFAYANMTLSEQLAIAPIQRYHADVLTSQISHWL